VEGWKYKPSFLLRYLVLTDVAPRSKIARFDVLKGEIEVLESQLEKVDASGGNDGPILDNMCPLINEYCKLPFRSPIEAANKILDDIILAHMNVRATPKPYQAYAGDIGGWLAYIKSFFV
jgi:hypothetical protein